VGFDSVHDYADGKLDWLAFGLPVEGEAAGEPTAGSLSVALPTCRLDERLADVAARWPEGESWCAVVDQAGIVLGRLRRRELGEAAPDVPASAVMEEGPSTYRPSLPAAELLRHMDEGGFSRALVTDSAGRLLGAVTRERLAASD
jgi:CBS domain-containing protein